MSDDLQVLMVPGAGSDCWYWHRLAGELQQRGHRAEGVELPCDDDDAGLEAYREAIVAAMHDVRTVLVAHSFGTFSASLAASDRRVRAIVLIAPMIPAPHESADQWWTNTGHSEAVARSARIDGRDPDDPESTFLNGVPSEMRTELSDHYRDQSGRPFQDQWPLRAWPSKPTTMVVGVEDRFLPIEFQRHLARERLGITPTEISGGHLLPLTQPQALSDRLVAFLADLEP